MEDTGNIVIYESEGGDVRLDVRLENETVWLSQEQMAVLFNKSLSTVNYHINNIFKEGELDKDMVIRKIRITSPLGAVEGLFQQNDVTVYNLDVIISVGYRVHSIVGTRFRQWATKRLHEYIVKGFTMDDERLKQLGGGGYWKELLNRIRDIRASEKVFYRQILDIYATSVDYDPKADMSIEFFKKVQNKIHYATHGQTAAEIIYSRADWAKHLDNILTMNGEQLLVGSGSVSHQQAVEKAMDEYKKYQQRTLSDVERAYLYTIKMLEDKSGLKSLDR